MERAEFTIGDSPLAGPFAGYTKGETWNGWEVPYFTKDVAEAVVAAWVRGHDEITAHYDAERDAFIFASPDDGEDGPEVYEGVDTEDGRLYCIGGFYWTWERED